MQRITEYSNHSSHSPSLGLLVNIKVLKRKTDMAKEIISSYEVSVQNFQDNFGSISLFWDGPATKKDYIASFVTGSL
jgi:hypothetical protein